MFLQWRPISFAVHTNSATRTHEVYSYLSSLGSDICIYIIPMNILSMLSGNLATPIRYCPYPHPILWKSSRKNCDCYPKYGSVISGSSHSGHMTIQASGLKDNGELEDDGKAAKGSGTTARGRRLLRVREEKRKREYDRLHNYPSWAKVLEEACQHDIELRSVLGDSIGNPELMRKRVEERVRTKGQDFQKSKTGSVLAFKVSFRDFNPLDSYIWFQLYGAPSDREVDLFGSVVQAWYVMGRLGAFNSSNLQVANSFMVNTNPLYDAEAGFKVMPSSFHDISDVEFQDNWGRIWVDLGTADFFSIDVLLNCLTGLSSEYLGIQQVVFGGRCMGDWEEGMTDPQDGYKYFKI